MDRQNSVLNFFIKHIVLIILVVFVGLGGFWRFYQLDQSPPSLNWDEAALGYNSYLISHTMKDEFGVVLPIATRSFNDYKATGSVYLMIPFLWIFGMNEVGVRALSVFAGTVQILLAFFIAWKTFHSKRTSLMAALFVSIAPYGIFFSRTMFEANVATTLFSLGYLFFLYWDKTIQFLRYKIHLFRFLSVFFFIASMYTYHSFKILVPLVFIAFVLLSKRSLRELVLRGKQLMVWMVLLLIPMGILTLQGNSATRFQYTNILLHWPFSVINHLQNIGNPDIFSQITQFAPIYFLIIEVVGRYIAHFTPMDLFVRLSLENPVFIPANANLLPFEVIFWGIGLIALLKNAKKYSHFMVIVLLSPIPAIINWEWFYAARIIQLFFFYCIIMGYGVDLATSYLQKYYKNLLAKRIVSLVFVGIVATYCIWSGWYVFDSIMVLMPKFYAGNWQPGYKETVPVVGKLADQYDQVIVDTPHAEQYIFVLFYQAYPANKYFQDIDFTKIAPGQRTYFDFGKYHFRLIFWPEDRKLKKTLFLGTTSNLPEQDIKSQKNARILQDSGLLRVVSLD